jgi:hypothetical protein
MDTEEEDDIEEPDPGPKLCVRAQRRKENKKMSEYVIKTTLSSSFDRGFKENSELHNKLIQSLLKRVEATSKGCQRLSLAMNLMIKELIESKTNPLEIDIPIFLTGKTNITFARQLMVGLDGAKKINPYVKKFLLTKNSILPQVQERHFGDKNTITRAAEQYLTNYKTYLKETFQQKQNAFLNLWCSRHGLNGDIQTIRYLINGWKHTTSYVCTYEVTKLIEFHRKLLNLGVLNYEIKQEENPGMISTTWIKNNYERLIIYYGVMSKYLNKHELSGFPSAPLCKMKSTFIHIDTDVFHSILKELKIIDIALNEFKKDEVKKLQWSSIFNTNKFLTRSQIERNFNFTYTIQTDGLSICIHYRRPKLQNNKVEEDPYLPDKISSDRVIAQDPGRVNIFYGMEKLENGEIKKYKLTRAHYYEESGINYVNKCSNKWNLHIKNELEQLSKFSTRSSSKEFIGYMKVITNNYNTFWNEYLSRRWARQRLTTYSGKKSVYDKFFGSFKDGTNRRVVIAYGDAGFKSTSKYELSAPKSKILTEAKKWYKVVMVDEFRTTQICNETGKRLSKVVKIINYNNEVKLQRAVRGLLWCNSTKGSKFVDRDLNSCKNIMRCYESYPSRPQELDRITETQEEPTPKYINKNATGHVKINRKVFLSKSLLW